MSTTDEAAVQRRLEREARECCLGRLGDRAGANVARVEVTWWWGDFADELEQEAGHYLVHATGDEPDGIYAVFEQLTAEAMDARCERLRCAGWQIDDIYAA